VTKKLDDSVAPWIVESEREVLRTRVFTVHQRVCRSQVDPTLTGNFSVLDCPDWVNVIAVTEEGKIVLIEQFRHGTGELTLEIPGGMVDAGEGFVSAGLRELVEETGFVGEGAELIGVVAPNPAIQNNRCGTLLVRGVRPSGKTHLDTHEEIAVRLVSLDEVQELIRSGAIVHSLVVAAFQHLALREVG